MGSYKKIGLSHEMGLIDTPPLVYSIALWSLTKLVQMKVQDSLGQGGPRFKP